MDSISGSQNFGNRIRFEEVLESKNYSHYGV